MRRLRALLRRARRRQGRLLRRLVYLFDRLRGVAPRAEAETPADRGPRRVWPAGWGPREESGGGPAPAASRERHAQRERQRREREWRNRLAQIDALVASPPRTTPWQGLVQDGPVGALVDDMRQWIDTAALRRFQDLGGRKAGALRVSAIIDELGPGQAALLSRLIAPLIRRSTRGDRDPELVAVVARIRRRGWLA